MINIDSRAKVLFLSCTLFLHNVEGSASTTDSKRVQVEASDLSADIENMIGVIEELCSEDKKAIYLQRIGASERIRETIDKDSPLYCFPQLSEETYNSFVEVLKDILGENPEKAWLMLHLWSYIVGIPVVGLKHGRNYYESGNHLLPKLDEDDCKDIAISFDIKEICVKSDSADETIDGIRHRHIEVSDDLLASVVILRKKYFGFKRLGKKVENQKIAWDVLKREVISLERFKEGIIRSILEQLLGCYSLGIINLFQNTAIYISLEDGDNSEIITGPCSRETVRYLGLRDGIFIEQGMRNLDQLHELLGAQFFWRALFTQFPCIKKFPRECENCLPRLRCAYYPHYSFFLLPDKEVARKQRLYAFNADDQENLWAAEDRFAQKFCTYMKGESHKYPIIRVLIDYINRQQLRRVLSDKTALKKVLFSPTVTMNLSSMVSGEDEESGWDPKDFIRAVTEHLSCRDYQDVERIDLSNNNLGDDEVETLGELLDDNVLPALLVLNLSNNRITRKGLPFLHRLVGRDVFESLVLHSNSVRKILDLFPEQVHDKIVSTKRR